MGKELFLKRSNFRGSSIGNGKKRVHVGATNLAKSHSTPVLLPSGSTSVSTEQMAKILSASPFTTQLKSVPKRLQTPAISRSDSNRQKLQHRVKTALQSPASERNKFGWNTDDADLFDEKRMKLRTKVVSCFGSLASMFRAFDVEGNGTLSFEDFQKGVENYDFELDAREQELLYRTADKHQVNCLTLHGFTSAFEPNEAPNPFMEEGNANLALKYRSKLMLSPRSMDRVRECRHLLANAMTEIKGKHNISHESNAAHILHAFQQIDEAGKETLSHDEFRTAMGKTFLKLNLDEKEINYMINKVDTEKKGHIAYKEFITYFAMEGETPSLNALDENRNLELTSLKTMIDSNLMQMPKLVNVLPAESKSTPKQRDLPCDTSQVEDHRPQRLLCHRSHKAHQRESTAPHENKYQLSILDRKSNDRNAYRRNLATDWSRIGFGGNGVSKSSNLYCNAQDRFTSTQQEQFYDKSPSRLSQILKHSTSVQELDKTRKMQRNERVVNRIQNRNAHINKLVDTMNTRQDIRNTSNIRSKAKQRYNYLTSAHAQDANAEQENASPVKKSGGIAFHRMWTGSLESQFNSNSEGNCY